MKLKRDEVPRHFEGVRLRPWVVAAGWPTAVACAAAGVLLTARSLVTGLEALGVALAALGAVAIAALVRCRSYEIVVGVRLVSVGTGPLRRRVPVGLIEATAVRPAASWRRLYSDRELVLKLSADESQVVVPTADPEGLERTLSEARQ